MNDFNTRRVATIFKELESIAERTAEIAMSSYSDENKKNLIGPLMKRHGELIAEAKKLLG